MAEPVARLPEAVEAILYSFVVAVATLVLYNLFQAYGSAASSAAGNSSIVDKLMGPALVALVVVAAAVALAAAGLLFRSALGMIQGEG